MSKKATVRWCLRRDVERCVEIERASIQNPWEYEDFEICLRSKSSNGMVVEIGNLVVGHLMYSIRRPKLTIAALVVHPEHRRQGYATKMIHSLSRKITVPESNFSSVDCCVSERSLELHMFFKAAGFLASKVKPHHFGPDHDGYLFVKNRETPKSYESILEASR